MNQYDIYTRIDCENHNKPFPLPVYLRSIGYKRLDNGYWERLPELHSPFFEMIWCAKGIGEVILYKESFLLHANDIFFYHPNERHILHSLSDGWETYWITFDGPNAVAFFDSYNYPRKTHSKEPFPLDLYNEILQKISDSSPVTFRSMLALLCRLLALAGGEDVVESNPVQMALNLIQKNLSNPDLDVNFLADQLQIHRSTLVTLFKKRLGRLPSQAIRDRRIQFAEAFLRGTTLSVKEIASRCGIRDESSFCRLFRQTYKLTPMQYRLRK
ncbi:MAG: AraC family transcriptional regulator [Victivallales bacterium]|jgi:AraC-like DNA-binding protein|nr:AraC family transcriptional regulator [Victivallales bacterium]